MVSFERIRSVLYEPTQAHTLLGSIWRAAKPFLLAGHRLRIDVRADTRSLAQNRLLWWRLGDIAAQVPWHGMTLDADDWKAMLTASLRKQRVVPNIEGTGFVVLGDRTSQMTIAEMTELLELIDAFGSQRGVKFRDHELEAAYTADQMLTFSAPGIAAALEPVAPVLEGI